MSYWSEYDKYESRQDAKALRKIKKENPKRYKEIQDWNKKWNSRSAKVLKWLKLD